MDKFSKKYTGIFVAWILVALASILLLPNLSQLVSDKGQTKIPASAQSQVADTIQKHWGHKISNTRQVVVVFNNDDSKITDIQQSDIDATINSLKNDQAKYDIKKITAASDSSITRKQLISKDKTTELVQLDVGKKDSIRDMNDKIQDAVKTNGVKTYVTGSDILQDDFQLSTEEGIKKTEAITVVFILIVLIIVFRSLIVPFISLLSVGLSFIISLSIVANLVKYYNFPLSNFTQVFMVIVLFGIGTDYNILLFNEFKRQLAQGKDKVEATIASRKIAGRTILYSGSSVLIGFTALGLAKFSIYQSAVGVAVGVAVLLLVLLTFTPFFMAVWGEKIFWPSKNLEAEGGSRFWHFQAKSSVAHPIIVLVLLLAISLPIAMHYNNQLNYDNAVELSDSMPAKKGYLVVQDHFSKGTAEPATLYIKADHKLNNEKDLKELDRITKQIQKNPGIASVNSVTQPGGVAIKQLYVNDQLDTLTGNLNKVNNGLTKTTKGLTSSKFNTEPLENIGTSTQSIADQLAQIQTAAQSANTGATPTQMVEQLQSQLTAAGTPLNAIQQQALVTALTSSIEKQQATVSGTQAALTEVGSNTQTIATNAQDLADELQETQTKLMTASDGLKTMNSGVKQSNDYLKDLGKSAAADTFYIPSNIMNSKTFKDSTDMYLSGDQKTSRMIIVLDTDPNSEKSMKRVTDLQRQVQENLKGTDLKNATVAIGGQTALSADDKSISSQDFIRTAIIMIVGIGIALALITHSLLQPVYILAMLTLTYVTSLGITEFISKHLLGQNMLTWNTPFFTFVMLIALGVDYSIFLIMKYRENKDTGASVGQRMIEAATVIGTVIISAVIILGGTFAALIPSGVLTLIQVAIGVIVGLIILVIVIPLVMPAVMRLTYENISFANFFFYHGRKPKHSLDDDEK